MQHTIGPKLTLSSFWTVVWGLHYCGFFNWVIILTVTLLFLNWSINLLALILYVLIGSLLTAVLLLSSIKVLLLLIVWHTNK